MSRALFFVLFVATLAGCVHPMHYTVAQRDSDTIVLPPHANPTASESHFQTAIKNARSRPQFHTDCTIAGGPIAISWHGDTAKVQLDSEPSSAGDAVTFFESQPAHALQQALDNAQSKGCLGPDEEYRLKRALTERLPLSSSLARTILLGSFGLSGYVDLTPDLVLEFVSPIYPSGAGHIPGNLIGYETADYSFAEVKGDDRVHVSLLSVSEQLLGKPAISKPASQNPFPFSLPLSQFRFLLRSEKYSATALTRAIVLSAPQKKLLDQATAQIQAGLAEFCQAVAVPGVGCVVFPPDFAVNVKLRVFVNGKQTIVPTYATIGDLVGTDSLPKTLVVKRIFEGRLIRVTFDLNRDDILKLAAMPGDQITW
ncbi:MAG TPA: hypothetical protein VIY69_09845 [Candidatus Acidoferrales bacterium]